jgi:hypothetical protein
MPARGLPVPIRSDLRSFSNTRPFSRVLIEDLRVKNQTASEGYPKPLALNIFG